MNININDNINSTFFVESKPDFKSTDLNEYLESSFWLDGSVFKAKIKILNFFKIKESRNSNIYMLKIEFICLNFCTVRSNWLDSVKIIDKDMEMIDRYSDFDFAISDIGEKYDLEKLTNQKYIPKVKYILNIPYMLKSNEDVILYFKDCDVTKIL